MILKMVVDKPVRLYNDRIRLKAALINKKYVLFMTFARDQTLFLVSSFTTD